VVEEAFAPRTTLHGSLADVYGVGLLFIGRSGIGKSECVLDLVERGHRLVADDVVQVTRRGNDVLIGRGHELAAHHMEIRGIGLIDIPALFGVRSVRQQKRIEVVVQLEDWETAKDTDRTGLAREETMILDVAVPRVVVPLNPGKNITVISEVVAMMHLLRYSGVDVAAAFNARLIKRMKEQRGVREYLQEDYE
jgi:HPr kinase/phosphorylase